MSPNQNHQDATASNAGSVAVIANAVAKAIGKQLPSAQEERGDERLNQARDLVSSEEVQAMVEGSNLSVIEEKIIS